MRALSSIKIDPGKERNFSRWNHFLKNKMCFLSFGEFFCSVKLFSNIQKKFWEVFACWEASEEIINIFFCYIRKNSLKFFILQTMKWKGLQFIHVHNTYYLANIHIRILYHGFSVLKKENVRQTLIVGILCMSVSHAVSPELLKYQKRMEAVDYLQMQSLNNNNTWSHIKD